MEADGNGMGRESPNDKGDAGCVQREAPDNRYGSTCLRLALVFDSSLDLTNQTIKTNRDREGIIERRPGSLSLFAERSHRWKCLMNAIIYRVYSLQVTTRLYL